MARRPHTGTQIDTRAETHVLYCRVTSSEIRGRSIGASALCNAVSNCECDS